jgi:hypothetical protein
MNVHSVIIKKTKILIFKLVATSNLIKILYTEMKNPEEHISNLNILISIEHTFSLLD